MFEQKNINELETILMEKVRDLKDYSGEPERKVQVLSAILEVYKESKKCD